MPRLTNVPIIVFAALVLTVGAGYAFAQENTDGLRSTVSNNTPEGQGVGGDTPFYVPGMPVPAAEGGDGESSKGASEKKGTRSNRISKVTVVERGGPTGDKGTFGPQTLQVGEIYRGIVPGIKDWHQFARKARDAARSNPRMGNKMTWLGFQPFDNGSRVFVQTIKPVTYSVDEVANDDGTFDVKITLLGTRTPVRNNRRTLDTSYFRTAVIGARADRSGKNTVVTLNLHSRVNYELQQDSEFLYISLDDGGSEPFADKQNREESAAKAADADKPAKKPATVD